MFLRIFKGSAGIQLITILVTIILLWFPAFRHAYPMPRPELLAPAYAYLFQLIGNSPVLYTIIAVLLLMSGAILLKTLLSDTGLIQKNSYLISFIYIVLMSSSNNYLTLHPALFANIFIIILLRMIFIANEKNDSLKETFTAGLMAAICSLFVFKSAGLLISVWIFLIIIRVYSWRQFAVNLIGFITVYLYLFSWFLFSDGLLAKVALYSNVLRSIQTANIDVHISVYPFILLVLLLALLLISIINFLFNVSDKLIYIRRVSLVLFWLFITTTIFTIFYTYNIMYDLVFLALPVTILIALYLSATKRSFFGELMLMLIIVSIFLCRI